VLPVGEVFVVEIVVVVEVEVMYAVVAVDFKFGNFMLLLLLNNYY